MINVLRKPRKINNPWLFYYLKEKWRRNHHDSSAIVNIIENMENYPNLKLDFFFYALAVSTVQPSGTPFTPLTFQVAAEFLTNVPVDATPSTQFFV